MVGVDREGMLRGIEHRAIRVMVAVCVRKLPVALAEALIGIGFEAGNLLVAFNRQTVYLIGVVALVVYLHAGRDLVMHGMTLHHSQQHGLKGRRHHDDEAALIAMLANERIHLGAEKLLDVAVVEIAQILVYLLLGLSYEGSEHLLAHPALILGKVQLVGGAPEEHATDHIRTQLAGLGQMGSNGGGSALGDIAGLGVTLGAMGGVINMTKNAVAPMFDQTVGAAPAVSGWDCPSCGRKGIASNFCPDCGAKKPEARTGWDCTCGEKNISSNFCRTAARKGRCLRGSAPTAVWRI